MDRLRHLLLSVNSPKLKVSAILFFHIKYPDKDLKVSFHPVEQLVHVPVKWRHMVLSKMAMPKPVKESAYYEAVRSMFGHAEKQSKSSFWENSPNILKQTIDWGGFFNSPSSYPPIELIGSSEKLSYFTLLPILYLQVPSMVLIVEHDQPEYTAIKSFCSQLILPAALISNQLRSSQLSEVLTSFQDNPNPPIDETDLLEQFIIKIAEVTLPAALRISLSSWETFCNDFTGNETVINLDLLPVYKVAMRMPTLHLPKQLMHLHDAVDPKAQIAHVNELVGRYYNLIHEHWNLQNKYTQLIDLQTQSLLDKLEQTQAALKKVAAFQTVQEKQVGYFLSLAKRAFNPSTPYEYEFYKGSTGWHIRFGGKVVHTGRNDKGLHYIHKLLQHPGRKFLPNELEIISVEKDKTPHIQVSENFAITVHDRLANINTGDEHSYLEALKRLQDESPGEYDDLEKHIEYLSQLVYIAHSLKRIKSKGTYIDMYNSLKIRLDDKIFQFIQNTDDELYVRRVLSKSKVIARTIELDKHRRQLRQRVIKNMENAIANMDSDNIKLYFKETLTLQYQSYFTPDPLHPTDWKLQSDE